MQDFAVKLVRDQNTLMRDDMRVLRAAFGNPAIAFHPRVVRAARHSFVFHHGRIKQLRCFDVRPAPTQIRHRHHAKPAKRRRVVRKRARLRKGKNRGRRVGGRKHKVSVFRRAARDLPIDHAFIDMITRNQFAADGEPVVCAWCAFYADFRE